MNVLEKDIEELIFNNIYDTDLMKSKGFKVFESKYYRQPDLGSYGIPDIVGVSISYYRNYCRTLNFTIYELKKDAINVNALMQASRYVKGIQEILKLVDLKSLRIEDINFKIVLIGKTIETHGDFVFLCDYIENLILYIYELDFEKGVKFINHQGYHVTDPKPFIITEPIRDLLSGKWHNNPFPDLF